jgi:large subunit ribosomal protein L24
MQTIKPVTKPTKQRKKLFQAPDHVRYKFFAAPLSPELRASHGVRTLSVRSGDSVRIMRGDQKGFEGKITSINRKKYRIYVEGLTREKVDGTTIFVPIHPSKVMITRLNLDDKWRKKILDRKKAARKMVEEVAEKPPKKVVELEEAVEEKPPEKKPKRRKEKAAKKPTPEKMKEKAEEAKKETKPKTRKTKTKSKTVEKTEEGM